MFFFSLGEKDFKTEKKEKQSAEVKITPSH